MKRVITALMLFLVFVFVNGIEVRAEDIKKKEKLKKIYEAGGITKIEYNKAQNFLENFEEKTKEKKSKPSFDLSKKKKSKKKSKKKDKDKEEITLKKIEELGQIIKFDNTYFTEGMIKEFGVGCGGFKCKGDKAGQFLYKTFNKSKAYGQKNPGKMIKAMAMFEVFYASKFWYARKSVERYKENNYKKGLFSRKRKDEKEIRSLFGINKGRKSMREALGMNLETPTKEAIKKFWLLGKFLDLGTGVNNKKLAKDLKERQKLLEAYRVEIGSLKKKLQNDLDEEENEKSVE
jgi:hypothetical protein